MIMKITLTINGEIKTFPRPVTMRMTRTAYEMANDYSTALGRSKGRITEDMQDALVTWVVDAFDNAFTAEQLLDGYSGSFLEILEMAKELFTSLSSALIEFPKTKPEAQ